MQNSSLEIGFHACQVQDAQNTVNSTFFGSMGRTVYIYRHEVLICMVNFSELVGKHTNGSMNPMGYTVYCYISTSCSFL